MRWRICPLVGGERQSVGNANCVPYEGERVMNVMINKILQDSMQGRARVNLNQMLFDTYTLNIVILVTTISYLKTFSSCGNKTRFGVEVSPPPMRKQINFKITL